MHRLNLLLAIATWSLVVGISLWAQRSQLDRTVEALARIDAMSNLKKDMAIRKWASTLGSIYVDETRVGNGRNLGDQERGLLVRGNGEAVRLVSLTPIHILLAIQETHHKEYGSKERLTSLQLRNRDNVPDDWEERALKALGGGAPSVAEVLPAKGGHGLLRLMIPMRMEAECLECHRDTLVPVGGLRGGAAIAIDLDTYRAAQEPSWRSIQYWHFGAWLLGLAAILVIGRIARRRRLERERREEERRENELAFSVMAEGAVITDAAANILWVNDSFCAISGYARDEVIGRNPRLLKSDRNDAAVYRALWEALLTTGRWRGELWNRRKSGEVFPEEISIRALRGADGKVRRYIAIFSDVTERKLAEEHIRRMALRDALTDLPNRNLVEEMAPKLLAQAQRERTGCAVVFFDLDRFKQVNDALGHDAGDDLLLHAADRLRACFREGDLMARMGGDEFVALLGPEKRVHEAATAIVERAIDSFSKPFEVRGSTFSLGISAGIAVYPADGGDWHDLAKNADIALYAAKAAGRGTYRFFEAQMNVGALERAKLGSELVAALERNELYLAYQPQYDMVKGRAVSFEALLRWRHGEQTLLPGTFLPLVEGSWIMRKIGRFVAGAAARQLRAWLDAGAAPLPVSINASPIDLASGEFCAHVAGLCDALALPRELLRIEILESALESAEAESELVALAAAGFTISIDDFGTGYSSLSRLHTLPISEIKLDRSFVARLPDDPKAVSITRATVGVAQDLGIAMIAEGVENEAQRAVLVRLGCVFGQGWLFGRPVEAAKVASMLGERAAGH